MVAGAVVSAEVAVALEEKNAVAVAHTAFFDVRGGEEAVAAVLAVAVLVAVGAVGCGWHLHLVVVAENWRSTH